MNTNTGNIEKWQPPRQFASYEILEKIDDGGMGSIYKALHVPTQTIVAVKIMLHDSQYKRFEREAEAIKRLSHPNFVRFHNQGEISGKIYIVMDFIEGQPLKTFLDENNLNIKNKINIFHKILSAINFAHSNGVIHRDIKPDNIIITPQHEPILFDFGLSKCIELTQKKDETYLTLEGQILGTPGYMSPEQAKGETNKQDERTDIFSLGVILYEMLCDRNPFEGENLIEICYKIGNAPPTPIQQYLPSTPQELVQIIDTSLANDIKNRYQKVADFLEDLNQFIRNLKTRPIQQQPCNNDMSLAKTICLLCGAENTEEAIYCCECNQVLKHQFRRNTTKIKRKNIVVRPKEMVPLVHHKTPLMEVIAAKQPQNNSRISYPTYEEIPSFTEPKITKKTIPIFDILIGSLSFLFALLPTFHIYKFSLLLHVIDLSIGAIASLLLFKYYKNIAKYCIFPIAYLICCCVKHYFGIIGLPFDASFLPQILSGFVLTFFLSQSLVYIYQL